MTFNDLTPKQLRRLASDLVDDAHDDECERGSIEEEAGFDVVGANLALAEWLEFEAVLREAAGGE